MGTASPTVPTNAPSPSPTLSTLSPTNMPSLAPTTSMQATLFGDISMMEAIIIAASVLGVILLGIGVFCWMRNKRYKQEFGNKENYGLMGNAGQIALDHMAQFEHEQNEHQPGQVTVDYTVQVGDQQIVGTAEEINIISPDAPFR